MLRTNLSTRPFYNERLVRMALGAVALVALGLTAYNALQVWQLSSRSRDLRQQIERAEGDAQRLTREGAAVRQSLNQAQLDVMQVAAREANALITRRTFSWTDLFNRFEATLPGDVRISAVQPQVDADGRLLVAITVVARRVEDLDAFIQALEKTGTFRGILERDTEAVDDGTLRAVMQGYYVSASASELPPASDTAGRPPSAPEGATAQPGGAR
jgi:hypothetical protein